MELKLFAGLTGFLFICLLMLIWVEPYRLQRFFGFMTRGMIPTEKGIS